MSIRLRTEWFKIIAVLEQPAQFAVVVLAGSTRNCLNDKWIRNIQMLESFCNFQNSEITSDTSVEFGMILRYSRLQHRDSPATLTEGFPCFFLR